MSPHGMHLTDAREFLETHNSQLMSPHGMHLNSHAYKDTQTAPDSCLRTECIAALGVA